MYGSMGTRGFIQIALFIVMTKLHRTTQLWGLSPGSSWTRWNGVLVSFKYPFVTTENCPRGEPPQRKCFEGNVCEGLSRLLMDIGEPSLLWAVPSPGRRS